MSFGRKHLFHDALGVFNFYRIQDRFFRNADAPLAKSFQHVRLGDTLQSFELNVANDRQFVDFKDDANAAARCVFREHAGVDLVKETQAEKSLQITLS